MKQLLPFVLLLAVAFLADPCLAADPAPPLMAAHGTVEKVEKDTLTIKPRGADGKFGKSLVLHLTGTSKVTTLIPQTREGKAVMTQKETDAKDLKPDQAIAVIYTGGEIPVLLSAVTTAATDK
jgi:hypothetical protein